MTPPDKLPPRLRLAYIAITEFPRTNSITITGIGMFIATGVFLAIASISGYEISEVTLTIWLSAVLAVMGVGNWAESIKRKLPYPTPPIPPDAENVAATTGTPAPPAAGSGKPAAPATQSLSVPVIAAAHSFDPDA